jgi:hypothetical protein
MTLTNFMIILKGDSNNVPSDYDEATNRKIEIQFLDRNSHYDEMVAYLATEFNELENTLNDSIEIIRNLKILKDHIVSTREGAEFEKELEHLQMITEGIPGI